MRLVVKKGTRKVDEFQFTTGPVYIGRHTHSQIILPDRSVSRQHAVIFATQDKKWIVQDLDSANKTYLNNEEVHKAEIKTGDVLRITEFTIEIELEDEAEAEKPAHLEDTLIPAPREPQMIIRRLDAEHAPDMKLPANRAKDFSQATELICETNTLDEVLQTLLRIMSRQFSAYRTWCALRSDPAGPMTAHAGKRRDGQPIELIDTELSEKVNEAIDKGHFLLLPKVAAQKDKKVQSAMIAPITGFGGCFGVLYLDNAADHERYTLSDLDYLMLLAIHTATILKNF